VVLLREGWFISTKGVAFGHLEDRYGEQAVVDGFGLIAFASLFPIITVLAFAQISAWWAKPR